MTRHQLLCNLIASVTSSGYRENKTCVNQQFPIFNTLNKNKLNVQPFSKI